MTYNPSAGGGGGVGDGDKGDVTVSGTGATWTIDAQAVTLAKMANLAQDTVIGRVSSGTGVPEALTPTQARTVLGLGGSAVLSVGTSAGTVAAGDDARFTDARTPLTHTHAPSDITGTAVVTADARLSDARTPTAHAASHVNGTDDIQDATAAQKGLATAAQITKLDGIATGANNYSHPNHTGDVTSTGDGATAIANDAVTYAKMQNVSAASRLLGRGSAAGAGDPEELTIGSGLALTGTVLSATAGGGTVTSVGASVPTGLTISGSPVTGSGTLAIGLDTGYVVPLQSTLDGKQAASVISANGMGVVVHGATAGTARATGFAVVTWIGSVEPTNATNDDIWVDTA